MDKKTKKKIETINQRIQKRQQQLAGARKQQDEPGEVKKLEEEIAQLKAELKSLRG